MKVDFLDTVRNQAKNFASTVSLMDADRKHKVIIIDGMIIQLMMFNFYLDKYRIVL